MLPALMTRSQKDTVIRALEAGGGADPNQRPLGIPEFKQPTSWMEKLRPSWGEGFAEVSLLPSLAPRINSLHCFRVGTLFRGRRCPEPTLKSDA